MVDLVIAQSGHLHDFGSGKARDGEAENLFSNRLVGVGEFDTEFARQFALGVDAMLLVDSANVGVDRAVGNAQFGGDLGFGHGFEEELGDLLAATGGGAGDAGTVGLVNASRNEFGRTGDFPAVQESAAEVGDQLVPCTFAGTGEELDAVTAAAGEKRRVGGDRVKG